MAYQFKKHYTREEAQALLPEVRKWLDQLAGLQGRLQKSDRHMSSLLETGCDIGGEGVNSWIRQLAEMRGVLAEFQRREVLVKDIDRGLVDFPAIIGGREALLCWEKDEEIIEFWHDLDSGYAGRERL